jgi:hypothetical protein
MVDGEHQKNAGHAGVKVIRNFQQEVWFSCQMDEAVLCGAWGVGTVS